MSPFKSSTDAECRRACDHERTHQPGRYSAFWFGLCLVRCGFTTARPCFDGAMFAAMMLRRIGYRR
jgi:hypothetical protein